MRTVERTRKAKSTEGPLRRNWKKKSGFAPWKSGKRKAVQRGALGNTGNGQSANLQATGAAKASPAKRKIHSVTNARADEYRRQAEECRLQASKSRLEEEKAAWLTMAADWQRLAEDVDAHQGGSRRRPQRPAVYYYFYYSSKSGRSLA